MKRRGLNIQINLTNRAIYTLIAFTIFILAGVVVFSFGTSNPSTFGHSAKELDLSSGVDGNVIFNENLDVLGNGDFNKSVKIGFSSSSCTSEIEGALRYNSNSKCMEICNATSWEELGC